jgi:hypothetical protein
MNSQNVRPIKLKKFTNKEYFRDRVNLCLSHLDFLYLIIYKLIYNLLLLKCNPFFGHADNGKRTLEIKMRNVTRLTLKIVHFSLSIAR